MNDMLVNTKADEGHLNVLNLFWNSLQSEVEWVRDSIALMVSVSNQR